MGWIPARAVSQRAVMLPRTARRRSASGDRRTRWASEYGGSRLLIAGPRATRAGRQRSTRCARRGPAAQKLTDWRREAPIRPIVFEDAGVITDETVHLHLEQRVAQRLLARFRAQGFIYNDISRACLVQVPDSIPRVILLGRVSLYGRARRAPARGAGRSRRAVDRARTVETGRFRHTRARPSARSLETARRRARPRRPPASDRRSPNRLLGSARARRCRASSRSSSAAQTNWLPRPARSCASAASAKARCCARRS